MGALNEKERQQTLTEVEVLARCRHVNVIRYREAFLEDATLNIVMSYADGGEQKTFGYFIMHETII